MRNQQKEAIVNTITTYAIIITFFITMGFLLYKTQEKRLNNYGEWYCTEIYGMTKDCK